MVLESTMICVDNSEYMRNGDFIPTRMMAQQDAVNLVCLAKTRSNPENNVGLLTLANVEVLVTLSADLGKILSNLHRLEPNGAINLQTAICIAHLALRHRQGKNHKMRIVIFLGSPAKSLNAKEMEKLAKKLKKEKVNVDIIHFGDEAQPCDILSNFINILNGSDGTGSHLLIVKNGPLLTDALMESSILQGEDGAAGGGLGFEFGVDPNEDPELALALRVSMEEQRQRVDVNTTGGEMDASGIVAGSEDRSAAAGGAVPAAVAAAATAAGSNEDAMLEQALAMSMEQEGRNPIGSGSVAASAVNFAAMSEDEQIAYALQMSMQESQGSENQSVEKMDVDSPKSTGSSNDDKDGGNTANK